ncbi:DUF445 domain-containing protein [Massilia sp. GCM10020059]|uniref:DUF445 family protein n=1 Tax=Massilia agrisoli TaxID=2892444 RepID=A0ABS8IXX6_9BURK|nr:DUF445 family protein [Massilia agrisoli]MCC6073394.1 DUF445 family protein [Massilia agrisoli]
MTKEIELRKAKQLALAFLAGAAGLFVLTLFLPRVWWAELLEAFSEAAMVGALADWFAVVALFRRVPIPVVSRHTAIIPKNKEKIADNLALFVREKFLDTESIVGLVRRHDPAAKVAAWLALPAHTEQLGSYLVRLASGMLDFIDDAPVRSFISRAIRSAIGTVDLSRTAGVVLEALTRDGRHQALLDAGIGQLATVMGSEETQGYIADGIVNWLKDAYPFTEKVLPSDWLGRKGAEVAVATAHRIINDIHNDAQHPVRVNFNRFTAEFIERLKTDPEFVDKGEEIKRHLQDDESMNAYIGALWDDLREWIRKDLHSADSVLHKRVVGAGAWVGKVLQDDARLRASLNDHLEGAVRGAGPEFAQFLTRHIADTVKNWDSREMSEQVELNIGKDLQFIRINGTIVGGMIGVLLYLVSQLAAMVR